MKFNLPGGKRELIAKASSSIFIAVATASVVLAFCLVSINFMWDQASYNGQVNSQKEEARETLIRNIENSSTLIEDFAVLNSRPDLIEDQDDKTNSAVILDALPRRYDFPALVTSIDKLARVSGVKISSFSGTDQEESAVSSMVDPTPQAISFSVNVQGDYAAIRLFLTNLENTIRPMQVIQFRLSGSDNDMNVALEIITYYQPAVDVDIQTRNIQ